MSQYLRLLMVLFIGAALVGCGGQADQTPDDPEKKSAPVTVSGDKNPGTKEDPVETTEQKVLNTTSEQATLTPPSNIPAYDVTKDEMNSFLDLQIRDVSVSTDSTPSKNLEAITLDLWSQGSQKDALLVTFYPNKPTAASVGTSQVYANEQAARTIISAQYTNPSEADVEGQVQEAMANDGLVVTSFEEEVQELTEGSR